MLAMCTLDLRDPGRGEAGLCVYYDCAHYYAIGAYLTPQGRRVCVTRVVEDMRMIAADVPAPEGELRLSISGDKSAYTFRLGDDSLCDACTRLLSSEVIKHSFTGVMIGLYAIGVEVKFPSFIYQPLAG